MTRLRRAVSNHRDWVRYRQLTLGQFAQAHRAAALTSPLVGQHRVASARYQRLIHSFFI